jgi:uncharacterized protein
LLLLCLGEMWYFVRNDAADYAAFKLLTQTAGRQRRYRIWTLKSFLIFSGTTLLGLSLLGRLQALALLPPEFSGLAGTLRSSLGGRHLPGTAFLTGFGSALLVGIIAGAIIGGLRGRKTNTVMLGDIEPLMPRNGAETLHTALLSLNAGLSEELFFRLLLPLLLTLLLGNAISACVLAILLFGIIHAYQGWVGVAATTVLGAALTALYVWTGNIWIAAGAHALLDIVGLVIKPSIARLFAPRT